MKGGTEVYPPSAARVGPMQGPTEVILPGPGPGRVDMPRGDGAKLLVCFLGVFVCYFYYGILQESIMRGKYGEGDKIETFHFATSLVFLQCAINAAFAKLVMMLVTKPGPDHTSWSLYGACSLSYLGAMVSSNSALQFINYPTQVLGKSCKPIPVMMLGVLLTKRRYPLTKYVCVLLIVAGVAMFMYKGQKGPDVKETGPLLGYGELLLLLSLTLDGLTGVTQDNMRIHYHTGSHAMMFYVNLCSSILLAVAAVLTGDLFELLSFSERHPGIIVNVLLFGLASAMGQNFIFMTVVGFGPLTCSIITTTRKFFTILASVLIFANPLSPLQWSGTVLVFIGLGLDSIYGKTAKK